MDDEKIRKRVTEYMYHIVNYLLFFSLLPLAAMCFIDIMYIAAVFGVLALMAVNILTWGILMICIKHKENTCCT